jgi:hypothetical protein
MRLCNAAAAFGLVSGKKKDTLISGRQRRNTWTIGRHSSPLSGPLPR